MGTGAQSSMGQELVQQPNATPSGITLEQSQSAAPSPAVIARDGDFSVLAAPSVLEAAISSIPSTETTVRVPSASVPMHLQKEDAPYESAAAEAIHENAIPTALSSTRLAGKPKVNSCAERTIGSPAISKHHSVAFTPSKPAGHLHVAPVARHAPNAAQGLVVSSCCVIVLGLSEPWGRLATMCRVT